MVVNSVGKKVNTRRLWKADVGYRPMVTDPQMDATWLGPRVGRIVRPGAAEGKRDSLPSRSSARKRVSHQRHVQSVRRFRTSPAV